MFGFGFLMFECGVVGGCDGDFGIFGCVYGVCVMMCVFGGCVWWIGCVCGGVVCGGVECVS